MFIDDVVIGRGIVGIRSEALTAAGFGLRLLRGPVMPFLFIHLRNSDFCARDEGAEFDTPEAALALGVRGALETAVNEIGQGRHSTAVVVNVEEGDGTGLLTSVVAVSVSALTISEATSHDDI